MRDVNGKLSSKPWSIWIAYTFEAPNHPEQKKSRPSLILLYFGVIRTNPINKFLRYYNEPFKQKIKKLFKTLSRRNVKNNIVSVEKVVCYADVIAIIIMKIPKSNVI